MAYNSRQIYVKSFYTGISLDERFTALRHVSPPSLAIRRNVSNERLASQRNQRWAIQMENRPTVRAALKGGRRGGFLSRRGYNSSNFRGRGEPRSFRVNNTWNGRGAQSQGRGGLNRRRMGASQGRSRRGQRGIRRGRGGVTPRGTSKTRGVRSRGRGGRMGRGTRTTSRRGRGGGGRGRGSTGKVSREQLDSELDTYMATTKSHLNAEMDAYKEDKGEEKEMWG